MAGEPPRVPTAGDPAGYGEMDEMGDVELHKGRYWGVSLCAGVGSSGEVGSRAGVGGADAVVSGSGGSGDSDSRGGVDGS